VIKYFELKNIMPFTSLICSYFYHEYNSYYSVDVLRSSKGTRRLN